MSSLIWRIAPKLFLFVVSQSPVSSQTSSLPEPLCLTSTMLSEDSRLEQKITLTYPDICLGELLEEISQKTGVVFTIDPDEGASGVYVLTRFKNLPLIEAMNAIWSSVSYKNAEWLWDREGKKGSYRYRLVRTRKAKTLSLLIDRLAEKAIERCVDVMLKVGLATPSERKTMETELNEALMRDKEMMKEYPPYLWDDETWRSTKMLALLMKKAQIMEVFRGGAFSISLEKAPPLVKEMFKKDFEERFRPGPPTYAPLELPETITYYSYGARERNSRFVPGLYIKYGDYGGTGALGGHVLNPGFLKFIKDLWHLPGEALTSALEQRKIPTPDHPEKDPTTFTIEEQKANFLLNQGKPIRLAPTHVSPMATRLMQVAEGANLSVCAIANPEPGFVLPLPYGKTVFQYLNRTSLSPDTPMWKWRREVMVISYPIWYQEAEGYYPYRVVKEVQPLLKKHLPSAAELARLKGMVNDEQWAALQGRYDQLRGLMGSKLALSYASVNSNLTQFNGVPLTDEVLDVLPVSVRKARDAGATAVRLKSVKEVADSKRNLTERYLLELQTLNKDGKWRWVETWELW